MRKMRVLVVDDDQVDRISVRRSLRAGGFDVDVQEADSCAAALAALETGEIGAAFLDYMLPDGTGLSVLQAARARGVWAPIIILTGQGDEQTAVELMKAGASDYMPKSQASPERIAQVLRSALRIQQAEQQAVEAQRERARALVLEQRARDDAEAAQRRLAFLAEASALVSASLDYEETLQNVARLTVPALADWCFVDLLEDDGGFTRMAVAHADPQQADLALRLRRRYQGLPDAPHGVSRVIATGRSEVMSDAPDWLLVSLARDGEHLAMMRELRPASIMTVPLVARGRTLGAMSCISLVPQRYGLDDLAFAEEIARRAALAVDNARLYSDVRRGQEALRRELEERLRTQQELDASRRQLAQTEKLSALGTLVSGVAHELRTPLTYLTNNLWLLQARLDAAAREQAAVRPVADDVRRFAAAAMEGVDRINALVRDLRPFARGESGGKRALAGVHEVVGGAVDLFRATQRGRVEVLADLRPTEPLLLDKGQLQRVVINLLLNAADAMPRGGRIRVSTRATPEGAVLEVEDEGTGIAPEVEGRIFDPFFTTKAEGTGLGLAITRRIVEAHGGRIEYQTALGRGTTFTITFPQAGTPVPIEQAGEAASEAAAAAR